MSVVISAYNAERYLEQCLSSVVGQTLKEIEIILINDGSTDHTLEIMNEFATEDSRIKIIDKENGGAGSGRNAGLRIASGKYIIFLDADDFFEKEMLEKMYVRAEKDKLDMVICQAREYDELQNRFKRIMKWNADKSNFKKEIFSYKDNKEKIFQSINTWAWNKLILKSIIDSNNLNFQEIKSSNDVLIVTVLLTVCERITIIDDVLVYHRINNPQSLQYTKNETWKCAIDSTLETIKILTELRIFKDVEKSCINKIIHILFLYYNSVTNLDEKKKMAMELKNIFFSEVKIDQYPDDFFYNPVHLSVMKSIVKGDIEHCNCLIPILLVSNNHSSKLTYVTIKSIIKNKNDDTGIIFYIFLNDSWYVHKNDILELCVKNRNVNVIFTNISDYRKCNIKINDYATAMCDCLFNNNTIVKFDKAIFIQNNVIVNCDLNKIMSIKISEYHLAATIKDPNDKAVNIIPQTDACSTNIMINSDFMLLNIKRIKTENMYSSIVNAMDKICPLGEGVSKTIKVLPIPYNTPRDGIIEITETVNRVDNKSNSNANENESVAIIYQKPNRPWLNRHNNGADVWWKYGDDCQISFNFLRLFVIDLCSYFKHR